MSVCTRDFLSHPVDEKNSSPLLVDHLLKVAHKSKELFSKTKFSNKDLAFYSGLLHDVGKINPIYQSIFSETEKTKQKEIEESELKKYAKEHSRFSAWAADKLLQKIGLDYDTIDKIMVLIYGHHSTIRQKLGIFPRTNEFIESQNKINSKLCELKSQLSKKSEFSRLNWNSCIEKFSRPIEFDVTLKSKNSPDDYLEMSCAFSCLLQADRGSFYEWSVPNFDLNINTDSLFKKSPDTSTSLGTIRTDFQEQVMKNFDDKKPISVINAPTGIGKTKVFLDIINRYSNDKAVDRVFYFSPLLALTEDFEAKIGNPKVVPEEKQTDILIYNHMFSDSLKEKNNKNKENETRHSNPWVFENESFNKKFVITTTQRLLMTIYSNKSNDKMKMASFVNSVLIIDEVQTIPKPILSNLKEIFKKMNQYMGTKFILVSATIPHEIHDIKPVEISEGILTRYLSQTKKQIAFRDFDVTQLPIEKTLVMSNTRRKAVRKYSEIKQAHPDKTVLYISTGIKKQDRSEILEKLSASSDYVLVSTQVVEAGVDISFSHMFREEAPLDNIIQVLGRLNREGRNDNAELVIFPTEDGKPIPYSPLEFQVSQEKIQKIIKEKKNSEGLYGIMEEYYSEIYKRNQNNQNDTSKLERQIERMDFDAVWELVKGLAFQEDNRDTVFIPKPEEWERVRDGLLSNNTSKKNFREFGRLTASLPIPLYKLEKEGKNLFDEKLLEKNILLPQKQYLETIYDKDTGLDKWLTE